MARLAFTPPKIKVPLGEFVALDHDRRVEYVVELVKQEMRASLSPGVGAFEPTLSCVPSSGGAVDDLTRREILEFSAVRNCLAHRKGIVDELLRACGAQS